MGIKMIVKCKTNATSSSSYRSAGATNAWVAYCCVTCVFIVYLCLFVRPGLCDDLSPYFCLSSEVAHPSELNQLVSTKS